MTSTAPSQPPKLNSDSTTAVQPWTPWSGQSPITPLGNFVEEFQSKLCIGNPFLTEHSMPPPGSPPVNPSTPAVFPGIVRPPTPFPFPEETKPKDSLEVYLRQVDEHQSRVYPVVPWTTASASWYWLIDHCQLSTAHYYNLNTKVVSVQYKDSTVRPILHSYLTAHVPRPWE